MKLRIAMFVLAIFCAAIPVVLVDTSAGEAINISVEHREQSYAPSCEPTLRGRLPKGEGWLYEVKFDGYRMQVHKAGKAITLYTRKGAGLDGAAPTPCCGTRIAALLFCDHRLRARAS